MGNHEWCSGCETSDFHTGVPCDPKRKAKVDKEKAEQKALRDKALAAAENFIERMQREGIVARMGDYGTVVISIWEFLD